MRQLPRATREGYAESTLPLGALFDRSDLPGPDREARPAMIWFSMLEPNEKLEKRLFDNYDIAVASRWFDCVRIYVDDIESKADRDRYAKVAPTIVFLDGSGREVTRLAGASVSSPQVYEAMQKAAAPDFKKPLPTLVEKYSAFLKRFDKVQGRVTDLEVDILAGQEHIMKHDCATGRKQLKEDEEAVKPLRVERDKLLDEEKSLLKPEPKSAKNETASAGGAEK
jgi:hypothetical protein